MRFHALVVLLLLVASLGYSAPATAQKDAVAAVTSVLDRMNHGWEAGDIAILDTIMVKDKDAVWIGTDAGEYMIGYEAIKTAMTKQFAATKDTRIQLKQRSVKIASSGTSAWAAEVLDMKTHSGAEVVDLPGIRVTAVLEKRKGTWLLAHLHCSIPAAGQAIKY